MKKKLLFILSSICLIAPVITSCGTMKSDDLLPGGNNESGNNEGDTDNNGGDSSGDSDNNGGNPGGGQDVQDLHKISFDYSFMPEDSYNITNSNVMEGITDSKKLLQDAKASNLYSWEGSNLKFSSSSKSGSLELIFKETLDFDGITFDLSKFKNDNAALKFTIGNYSDTISPIGNKAYYKSFPKVSSNKIRIEATTKRFILNSLTINANTSNNPGGDTGDNTKPVVPKPATLTIQKIGEGEIIASKKSGMSGDKVTFSVTLPENTYIRLTNNGDRIGKENGVYTFTLVPGENKVKAEFIKYIPGQGHPEYFVSSEVQYMGDRGNSKVSLEEYYEPVRGLKGKALKDALYEICQPKETFSYDDLKTTMKFTDIDPDNPDYIYLEYTGELYPVTSFEKTGFSSYINREHVWPNSLGVGTSGPGSDKHMQRPCEQKINSKRGHRDFNYETCEEEPGINAGNKVDTYFEPKDEFKGDVARTVFYMATVYSELEVKAPRNQGFYNWSNLVKGDHTLGSFDALYEWITDPSIDPVSKFEMNKNNVVDIDYQHNRNPFIDHPEFVEMIYDKNYSGPGALLD